MNRKLYRSVWLAGVLLLIASLACGGAAAQATTVVPTDTSAPPTSTSRPTSTPRPTATPDVAATQQVEEMNALVQDYYDKGYLAMKEGEFTSYEDFDQDWAQIGWYNWSTFDQKASDFFLSAHFKWSTAVKTSDLSGCGFVFAVQENNDHYAVFLDKSRIVFLQAAVRFGKYSHEVGKTRGTGRVSFGNPAAADFTLIVKGAYAYVLVDGKVVGEYTLSADTPMNGNVGLTVLSGTNRDYGTRCEMTNIRLWVPNQ